MILLVAMADFNFTYPFLDKFPGDKSWNLQQRQTPNLFYCLTHPIGFSKANLIHTNATLLNLFEINTPLPKAWENIFNANIPNEYLTYATAYAGHQFGQWAGQLGDGRAIYFGEIKDRKQQNWELQWKGAGATPYSRRGDGRAVLRSTIREYLMSEAMHYLGIPTTRSLSISLSGEDVMRDIMYNGNAKAELGAVMVRTAESFLRFGHFEFTSANGNTTLLKDLTDWTIKRYFPDIQTQGVEKYLDFFKEVKDRTLKMIIEWYRVGFVHGVMNTDNMSVLGLSIDYGPYAMLDEYDLNFTPNTTDLPGRRYAFGQQGNIALWNLNAFANAIFPLINDAEPLQEILEEFEGDFWKAFDEMMSRKLGFDKLKSEDEQLIKEWQLMMLDIKADYTLFFIELMKFHQGKEMNNEAFLYNELTSSQEKKLISFLKNYKNRIEQNVISKEESINLMQKANPQFILRNFQLYECIQEAEKGNYEMFNQLYDALQTPYKNKYPTFQQKRPNWANGVAGCSMLSCSS